jgi:hypothetical protein
MGDLPNGHLVAAANFFIGTAGLPFRAAANFLIGMAGSSFGAAAAASQ